ncbi:MAG: BirA family transcriptional regulator [Thermoanaerobaculia bacterium]|jgi:BirA family biotin operon repressor/biotin-[acetyl-CoA-carboxylase] ligase|nr:BirA family transcriptional regulator [Thermoanaerobaculia bacterium]
MSIDTRRIVPRLTTIESIAVIPRVASTNLVARRIVNECIENELSLPKAIIIAGEQFAGRGRNARQWSSPAGKGVYATTLLPIPVDTLPLIPLEIANIVASYLREVFGLDARIKWPNDVLVGGRKIAGILIEARINEERAFLLIGTGINVEPVADDTRPNATSISEVTKEFHGIDVATEAFIEHLDKRLGRPLDRDAVLEEWRKYAIHQPGDRIECVIGERTVKGTWAGIDEHGRALLRDGGETLAVSAGDLILV